MLENFQLATIIKEGIETKMLRIPLHQTLQDNLAEDWQTQHDSFVADIDEISFNIGYQPEEHERFYLSDFKLPGWLLEENSQTVSDLDAISQNDALIDSIKGTVAFVRNGQDEELILFQNFTRSQVIRPGRFLLLENHTYKGIEHPGLTLDGKLSAVYLPAKRKLLFRNFRAVNTFLPLSDFYKEVSEKEIREILNHERLAPKDADALATGANQWFRKRFAMLKDSGVLDRYSARKIKERSNGYEIKIDISKGKIVFPADKPTAKKLLQFLNEEIFRGAITATRYETNSKRKAD